MLLEKGGYCGRSRLRYSSLVIWDITIQERKLRLLFILVKDSVRCEIYGGNYGSPHEEEVHDRCMIDTYSIFLIFLSSIQGCGGFGQAGNSKLFYLKDLPS